MSSSSGCWVGIDVAKATLDVQLGEHGPTRRVANTPRGHRQVIRELETRPVAGLVLEATGPSHRLLVQALITAGYPPAVINPQWIRAFRRSDGAWAKNDPKDARLLARYGQQKHPRPARILTAPERDLRALLSGREALVAMRAAEKNRVQMTTHPVLVAQITQRIAALDADVAELETAINVCIASDARLQRRRAVLVSMPGIGPVIRATLVAYLPELGEMDRRQLAALAGLAPYDQDSGTHRGRRAIAGGRAIVRTALYQAATTAARHQPVFRAHKENLKRTKPHNVVMVALARRLLGILAAMVREDLAWDQTKVGQGAYPQGT